jgi:hypothetical protein
MTLQADEKSFVEWTAKERFNAIGSKDVWFSAGSFAVSIMDGKAS